MMRRCLLLTVLAACGGRTGLDSVVLQAEAGAQAPDGSAIDANTPVDASDASTIDATTGPIVLAPGICPLVIALDATNVYWPNRAGETVLKCAKGGCGGGPTTLASAADSESSPFAPFMGNTSIAVGGSSVYWARHGGTVWKCGVDGCGGTPLLLAKIPAFGGNLEVSSVCVDDSNVYFDSNQGLVECATGGCGGTPTTLLSHGGSDYEGGIALGSGTMYFSAGPSVQTCATSGCGDKPTVLASGPSNAGPVAVDGVSVYWVNEGVGLGNGSVMKCALGGCNGKPTVLAYGQGILASIAVDGTNVYWTTGGEGKVMKCAVGGCGTTPTMLASGQSQPRGIAVDETSVYWANYGNGGDCNGSIMKLTPK